MRILLDENMPRKLVEALVVEGHEVHSVKSLRLDGIDNGALYELARREYKRIGSNMRMATSGRKH